MRVTSPHAPNASCSAARTASSPRLVSKPRTNTVSVSVGLRLETALLRGAATSHLMFRPSTSAPCIVSAARAASAGVANSTCAKPRALPVSLS